MVSRRIALAGFFLALLLVSAGASAHEVGLSRGEYAAVAEVVSIRLIFARREVAGAVPELDADRDGALSGEEVRRASEALRRAFIDRIEVKGDGAVCPGALDEASLAEEDGLALRATFRCSKVPAKVRVELGFFSELPHGHRHIARAPSGDLVLFRASRVLELEPASGAGAATATGAGAGAEAATGPGMLALFFMGIEHILLGFDHLVFLLGLVLVGGKLRSMMVVVTAFTVAHSITLGVAALGLWVPSPRIVEPLIALSIVYVGVENFFVKDIDKRWRITFPFGMVHGFGFAGALGEVSLPRAEVPAMLLSFNLGVEAGQVAVLALVLPLLLAAKKRAWFGRAWFEEKGVKGVSAAIIAAGLFWFVTRAFDVKFG